MHPVGLVGGICSQLHVLDHAGLLSFLKACDVNGTLGAAELRDVVVASSNEGVLASLAMHYGLDVHQSLPAGVEDQGACKDRDQSNVFQLSAWIDRQLGRANQT